MTPKPAITKEWELYIILAENGKLYTGIALDAEKRFQQHLNSSKGAKFFRSTQPSAIVYKEKCADRSKAQQREAEIKQLSRIKKMALISNYQTHQ